MKQMKEQNVSEKDPEYLKVLSVLNGLKAQQQMQKAAYAQAQQQQQQQAANQQNNPSSATTNGSNGTRAPTHSNSNTPNTSQAPTSTPLGPSAISTSSASAMPKGAIPRSAPSGSGYFSPQQLNILKHQISAFKCLSKNMGIPAQIQQELFASQQRKKLSQDQPLIPSSGSADDTSSTNNGADSSKGEADAVQKKHEYTSFVSPYTQLTFPLHYSKHKTRDLRPMIPSIMPPGVDFEKLRNEREIIIYNRMQARLSELKSLPANLAHLDASSDDLVPDDSVKRKALIEMKMLGLYQKQKAMRDRIGRSIVQYDNLAMTANRSHYRRMKKQSLREARITEKLEKQQRDARETREKKKHSDYIRTVLQHSQEIATAGHNQKFKFQKVGRMMLAQHQNIEKEEQKRIERTAKQRLQALKSNDEEAYLKLLDKAKDTLSI